MPSPERGDIYHIDALKGETMGHEFYGPHWWVVLSIGELNSRLQVFTAVPLTSIINKSTGKPKDTEVFRYFRIRILEKDKIGDPGQNSAILIGESLAEPEQIRVFSTLRITSPRIGRVTTEALGAIETGLLFVIGKGITRETTTVAPQPSQPAPKRLSMPTDPPKALPGKPKS